MKKILLLAVFAVFAVFVVIAVPVWLMLSPSVIAPVAWQPPAAPPLTGPYAANDVLKGLQRLAVGVGEGPEGLAVDATGRVYAGYLDGRVIRLSADGGSYVELANTGGRPLGIGFGPDGGLVVADAKKGLLHIGSKPQADVLATEADGLPLGFTDDVDSARLSKEVYFTDASSKFPFPYYLKDLLEHRPHGRLLSYNVETRQTKTLLSDLYFANGVAVGPDDAYVLVNETAAYRIVRYWLKGARAGTHDIFIDNLPGFPDNLSFNGRDRFWVALPSLRDPQLDALAGRPLLRKLMARLPGRVQGWLQSGKPKHSFVLGLDLNGHVVVNLQYAGEDAYAPITSVEERGPWLYFGSFSERAIARLPLNRIDPDTPPPAAGWENAPARPVVAARSKSETEEDD